MSNAIGAYRLIIVLVADDLALETYELIVCIDVSVIIDFNTFVFMVF